MKYLVSLFLVLSTLVAFGANEAIQHNQFTTNLPNATIDWSGGHLKVKTNDPGAGHVFTWDDVSNNIVSGTNFLSAPSGRTNDGSTLTNLNVSTNVVAGSGITVTILGNNASVKTNGAPLAGDVTGPTGVNAVATVGGQTAANVAAAAVLANAATTNNTANTIVKRGPDGSFAAANVTLSGYVTNNATNFFNGQSYTTPDDLVTNGICTLTAANGTQLWTISSGAMDDNIGQVFSLNTVQQYTVASKVDDTHFYTTTPAQSNFVNNSPLIFPAPFLFRDVSVNNGFVRGAIDGGGCLHVTSDAQISGIFIHDGNNGLTNGWTIGQTIFHGIPALGFFSWCGDKDVFQVSDNAPYNDLCVDQNGDICIRGALVNSDFGDLILGGGTNSQTTNIQVRAYMNAGGLNLSNALTVAGNISKGGTVWNSIVAGQTNLMNLFWADPNSQNVTISNLLVIRPNYAGSGSLAIDVAGNGTGIAGAGNGLAIVQGTTIIETVNNNGANNGSGSPSVRFEGNNAHSEMYNQFPGQWDLGDAAKPFGTIFATNVAIATLTVTNTNGLLVGGPTNTASFTLVNTNWVSGKLYTNQTGRPIMVIMPCQITMTGVSGNSTFSLLVTGITTNSLSMNTLVTSLATSLTNQVSAFVAPNGTFTPTNLSSGAGDSGSPVNGGQYMVY